MLKKLLRLLIVLVILIVVGLIVLWIYIDAVAAAALTRGVRYAGDVPCEVDRVSVSLLGGSVGVNGLAVKNPPAYPEADMFAVRRADVEVRIRSLWNQPVNVKRLDIIKPVVRLDAGAAGTNVQVFLDNVRRKVGEPGPEAKKQTRIIVDKLLIKDATIQLGSGVGPAGIASIALETVELSDIRGRDGRGVTSGELAARIVYELVRQGALKGKYNLNEIIPPAAAEAFEKATKAAEKLLERLKPLDELLKPKEGTGPAE